MRQARRPGLVGAALCCLAATACDTQSEPLAPARPELFAPGTVSTRGASEVRLAIRPDGMQRVWGAIGRGEAGQLDLWESHRLARGLWSEPARLPFNGPGEDFDPAFSPDGRRLYFHSERAGGFGQTDIYVAGVEADGFSFADPRNLGPEVNSAGAEWAPLPLADGGLLFASDGWGGEGLHDLFLATPAVAGSRPANLGQPVNGPEEDFDSALSPDGMTLIFSRGTFGETSNAVALHAATRGSDGWSAPVKVPLGCGGFTIGSSFGPGGRFYFASDCGKAGAGRMDIFSIRYEPPVAIHSPQTGH
jgi:hypothetical protein